MRQTILLMAVVLVGLTAGWAVGQTKPAIPAEAQKPRFQIRRVLEAEDKGPAVVVPGRDERTGQDQWRLGQEILLEGKDVASAAVAKDAQTERPTINLQLNKEGAEKFAKATQDNLKKRLAMLIDGKVVFAPTVQSAITGGQGMITFGTGTKPEEVEAAAKAINGEAQGQALTRPGNAGR